MAQRSQMFYAYFRFYTNETTIIAGLEQHCTEWEHMFAVGYNYKEYKCFVDNIGGFEHWVGDMRGYISQTREMGFTDGAPSDNVFDQTLLMGTQRITTGHPVILNGFRPDANFILRKIIAQDAGIANKVEITCGKDQKIIHPVMYTLDTSGLEVIKQVSAGIVDNSNVDSYEMMVDIDIIEIRTCTEDSHSTYFSSYDDLTKMFDQDMDTYCKFEPTVNRDSWVILDMGQTFEGIGFKIYNKHGTGSETGRTIIYTSTDKVAWTEIIDTGFVDGIFYGGKCGLDHHRYVKMFNDSKLDDGGALYHPWWYVYTLITS